MAPGGAPSSGCLLWDSEHFGELTNSKNFLSCTFHRSWALRASRTAGPTLWPPARPCGAAPQRRGASKLHLDATMAGAPRAAPRPLEHAEARIH